jgi:type I restriction enzyme S subunit
MTMNQSCYALSGENQFYVHQLTIAAIQKLIHEAIGAVFSALVTKDFDEQIVIQATPQIETKFQNQVKEVYNLILLKTKENKKLSEFCDLLLSKLATIKN